MTDISTLRGIEQKRSIFAYECAEDGRDSETKAHSIALFKGHYFKDDKYKSYAKKIPMMIKTNGLGNAFAFILSKQKGIDKQKRKAGEKDNPKNAYDLIYEQVSYWLKSPDKKYLLDGKESQDLVKIFIQLDSAQYRAVTNEVLAFFNWLRRFADGLIDSDENGTTED